MKNFEQIMDKVSELKDISSKPMELPKECTEISDITESVKDTTEKNESLKDIIESGNIQMSWTSMNYSNSCGCNNACFNSCYNIG